MISSTFKKLFGAHNKKKTEITVPRVKDLADEEIPRYPPFAKGLPMSPVDKVLQTQNELIQKIKSTLGFTQEEYDRLVMPVIVRYASFVHLLPASESHHHRGAGGLFRHGLEVAFWGTQASESVIFSISDSPGERRNNEPRWRLACCFSGLLHDIGKPLSDVVITNSDGNKTWNPYSETLVEWAKRHNINRYFLRWRDRKHKRHEQFSLLSVERILTPEALEFLASPGKDIIESMLQAISGLRINDPVTKLMLKADSESVSRDLKQNRLDVDEFAYGVPVERYVFDALRRLVKMGKWKVNEPGAKVWHLHQGVFITWKQGVNDIYNLLTEDKIPGIPRDPDTLADILIERGFALKNVLPEHSKDTFYRYWEVIPELPQEEKEVTGKIKIQMLRLESSELIFTTEPPAAIAGKVIGDKNEQEFNVNELDNNVPKDEDEKSDSLTTTSKSNNSLDDGFEIPDFIKEPSTQEKGQEKNQEKGLKKTDKTSEACDFPFDAFGHNTKSDIVQKDKIETPNIPIKQSEKDTSLSDIDNIRLNKEYQPKATADTTKHEKIVSTENFQGAKTYSSNQQDKSNDFDTRANLEKILSEYGAAESILKKAIIPILDRQKTLGEVICFIKKKAVILYPEGARTLGTPAKILNTLFDAGAIVPDPIHPNRKVHDFSGIKGLLLSSDISNAIKTAINQVDNEEKQNISRLPKYQKSKITVNKPSKETRPMSLDFNSDLDLENKKNKKTQKAKEINDKNFLPPQSDINAEEAIRLLKEMIKNQKGRWLVGPIIKEDGCLVTSDKALEKVTDECTNLSKSMLRALLASGQRRPRMTIHQGNLRLELE